MSNWLKNYSGILWLLSGVTAGAIAGLVMGKQVVILKPLGDIFLNLLFIAVVPLVFFAISSAIANLNGTNRIGRLLSTTSLVFLGTILVSATVTIIAVRLFPIHEQLVAPAINEQISKKPFGEQLVQLFTTADFYQLFTRSSMLAMILFSVLLGFAVLRSGEDGVRFARFLNAGNEVFKQLFIILMKIAPIGLGAYFAYQVGYFGPKLFGAYAKSLGLYYSVGAVYFVVGFSAYAFIAGGVKGVKRYWQNSIIPSATAVSTCSSIATIPANLDAAKKMGVPDYITNITVPLGATLHKDGSSISSIVKMAVVFALFGKGFDTPEIIISALAITVLVSIVEGGIPNGGYVGELLFISAYGFPPEALPPAIIIGTLVDPLATLLNATGDTVAAMLVARFTNGKNWMDQQAA
ncbi:dicarboxylate/amino acid:cation symporter [Mucilaginibacter sp. JRF]|uniref:dicarboxylate/amino acid:cation symporter n=1 Tax=Mucilaginibacter sp. JRF TaxID=2780088 RepID=UPI00187EC3F5|nr:dicarboxylate/amino acid:cation symporter [Mucilaginibacter sp. JRF]MBE9586377.1 dicarboxylate/amino acid:cation symporter [Mucilaginibacter sp. JRF]